MIALSFVSFLGILRARFQSSKTALLSKSDESLRQELLQRLVEHRLLGPTRQVTEMQPDALPMRELPPGNTAALYLMYIAFMRQCSQAAVASRSTFYEVAKAWRCCLKFRRKTEHSMCLTCQTLKAAIHDASDI